ncbi:MAG: recombinase family protein [Verrucomicrobia bacterium]|nr:recombinase family protein [Verrucomicrobiota bacterium]
MQKAIIYTRVSTDDQAEKGFSLRDQKDRLVKHCENKGIEIVKHFEDDGYSAKTFDRPQFNNLLEFIKKNKGLIQKLIVVKWDRFSRNMLLAMLMKQTLKKYGVTVEAVEQPLDDDIPENLIMEAIYLAAPQVENARRSLNTTNGMRRALKEGRYVSTAPYGFKNARDAQNRPIIVHSEMAGVIRKAFEQIATGNYLIEILRKKLYKEGLKVSRSNFYTLLRNPIYCGKIRVKAFKDEPEEIVQGIHEPIVSEELFYDVQNVLDGKKKAKTKYSLVNDEYPMRGHLVCPRCGKTLTGSSALGNGGKYFYYHCTKGCKERHKSDGVHNAFEMWLNDISIKPEIASLYLAIMEDVYKTNEGDRQQEIKKLQKQIDDNVEMMDKSARKFVNEDLDKHDYKRIKESLSRECAELRSKIAELKAAESGYQEYCRYGFSLLSNMGHYYRTANIENRQKMLGLIFPEKLVYDNHTFQTMQPSEVLDLLCNGGKGFSDGKKEKSSKNAAQSCVVTPSGFKPETF